MADDKRKSSSFSWSDERNDALRDYSQDSTSGADIFYQERINSESMAYTPKKNKPLWSTPISGGHYYYDMPSDDGSDDSPVYDPRAQYDSYARQPKAQQQQPPFNQRPVQKGSEFNYGEGSAQRRQTLTKPNINNARSAGAKPESSGVPKARQKAQVAQSQSRSAGQRRAPQSRPDSSRTTQAERRNDSQHNKSLKQKQLVEKRNAEYENKRDKGVDPSEIRRKKAKSNKRSFKLNALAWAGLVVVVLAAVCILFCEVRGFPIAEFQIEGASIYTQEQILAAGGISSGDNMLKVRQKKTSAAVSKNLPYIQSVTVDWILPSTLRLEIVETTDKFLIENDEKIVCIDENGKIVSDTKKKAKKGQYLVKGFYPFEYELGEIFSPADDNGNKKRYDLIKKISAAIQESGLENCTEIDISDLEVFSVKCSKNCRIYLDGKSDFSACFSTVWEDLKNNAPKTNDPIYYDCRINKDNIDDSAIRFKGELVK